MAESRMDEVASELLRLSRDGKLQWEKSIRKNEYRVVFPDMSFSIRQLDWGSYQLNLIGETGQPIDSLDSEIDGVLADQFGESDPDPKEDNAQHEQLKTIYQSAENYVRDVGIAKALELLKQA